MGATNEQIRAARALVKETAETARAARAAILQAELERQRIDWAIRESDRRAEPYLRILRRAGGFSGLLPKL